MTAVAYAAVCHADQARATGDRPRDVDARINLAALLDLGPEITASPENVKSEAEAVKSDMRERDFDKALESALKLTQTNPTNPRAYNLLGAAYLGKKDVANARRSFEKAVSLRPDYGPALLNLAQLDLERGDAASARTRYQTVLAKDANNVAAMVGMAKVEAIDRHEKEEIAWLEKAKAADATAIVPRLFLGRSYLRTGQYAKALAEANEAATSQPNNPEFLDLLAQAQIANGQKADAVATYRKLASSQPKSPSALYRFGMAQIDSGDLAGAKDSLRRAVQLKPDYVEAVAALASVEIRSGRPAEALKWARNLNKAAPTSPAGFALEGDLLVNQGRNADAVKAYDKALALQANGVIAVKRHAALSGAGKNAEGDAHLQQWLKDHPDDIAAHQYMAGLNLKAGRETVAIEQYQYVLQRDANNLIALNNLANLYQRHGDPRALETAERAYRLMPQSPVIADTLGWMLVESGSTARGLEVIQKAAAQDPKNPQIRYHLAVALSKSGEKAQARTELEDLLKTNPEFPERKAAAALLRQL
jgi:putative PEP-CTERM system TPR-repeat lipoprotein